MTKPLSDADSSGSRLFRSALFGYGILAYIAGVGALLYTILILLGVCEFSGGPLGALSLAPAFGLDMLLLVAFALQHSVMARSSFKARWTRIVPVAAERSTYVFATGLVLAAVLGLWQPMPALVWSVQVPLARWLLLGLAVLGWSYLLGASFAIDHFELFGLQQVYRALRERPPLQAPFRVRWMYRFDRHPIMTGMLIGLWATPDMTLGRLVFALGSTAYIWIGVYFEERSLRRRLGRPYAEYCARVPSLVPSFSSSSPIGEPSRASHPNV